MVKYFGRESNSILLTAISFKIIHSSDFENVILS